MQTRPPTLTALDELRQDMAEATNTRKDGQGGGRDTDIDSGLPLQSSPVEMLSDHLAMGIDPQAPKPSLILMFAEEVVLQASEPRAVAGFTELSALGTITFEKERGGARDADVEQMDYAPIGVKSN
jgi:hypothetical protein